MLDENIYNSILYNAILKSQKKIKNKNRKWFQFWKQKMVDNPLYDPNPKYIEIEIIRGNKNG